MRRMFAMLIVLTPIALTACGSSSVVEAQTLSDPYPSVWPDLDEATDSTDSAVPGFEIFGDAEPTPVLIATQDIEAGTPFPVATMRMERTEIPLAIVPSTFVAPDDIDSLAGLVAKADIPRNQVIVGGLFVEPNVVQEIEEIAVGQVVVSVSLSAVDLVGSPLQAGDSVTANRRSRTIDDIAVLVVDEEFDVVTLVVPSEEAVWIAPVVAVVGDNLTIVNLAD